ncbi:hypothetical protein PFISCL1PPCAC_371, partial [Pristionchus fissidentatus]
RSLLLRMENMADLRDALPHGHLRSSYASILVNGIVASRRTLLAAPPATSRYNIRTLGKTVACEPPSTSPLAVHLIPLPPPPVLPAGAQGQSSQSRPTMPSQGLPAGGNGAAATAQSSATVPQGGPGGFPAQGGPAAASSATVPQGGPGGFPAQGGPAAAPMHVENRLFVPKAGTLMVDLHTHLARSAASIPR